MTTTTKPETKIDPLKLKEWAKPEKRWAYCIQNEQTLATHDDHAPALRLLEKFSPVNKAVDTTTGEPVYATLAHELVYAQIYAILRMSGGRDSDIRLAASLFLGNYAKSATLYSAMCYFSQYATEWKKTLKDFDAQDVIAQYKAFQQHWWKLKERAMADAEKSEKTAGKAAEKKAEGLENLRVMVHRRLSRGETMWDGTKPEDPEERRQYLEDHKDDIGIGICAYSPHLRHLVAKYAKEWQHTPADERTF